ncbi:MAG: S41 family peptidase, partial [Eubacteriales bacterium]|nr:S41 family peptidase [Eubacteriales bacterium]
MNRKTTRTIAKIIAFILISALVISSFTFVLFWASGTDRVYGAEVNSVKDLDRELDFFKDMMVDLRTNFKDELSYEELLNGAYQGVFDSLDDPYSVYYQSDQDRDHFEESVSGEFSGVGISLESYYGQCRVVAPIPGSPAEKVGILSGDIIIKVDGQDIGNMDLDSVVSRIRGKAGTELTLTVERKGTAISFTMVREAIRTVSVNYRLLDKYIGYIQITQFDNDSHLEFKNAKLKLIAQGAKSFIIDVRNNPGGYVSVAANIAGQLMPKGAITHFQQKGIIMETISASGEGDLNLPVVLLVNQGSASASEILAGAWQDSGTAILVGTTTFGKGVAQQIIDLPNGSAAKLSMYYFLTPKHRIIDRVGITPDYLVENYKDKDTVALMEQYKGFAPMSEKVKPKAGSTGLNVYGAQQRLSLLGYDVTVSGIMDEKTVSG